MLAHAPGAVVIFVGADAVPEPGFVAAHLTTHREAGEPCVVLGKTRSETPRRAGPFLRWIAIQPPLPKDPFERIDLTLSRMDDSNLSISRVLFETERFEEQFSEAGWEMIELCYRLSARGVPIFPSSHAAVLRAQPARIGAWLQRRETLGRQQRLLEKLHPELKTALPEGIPPRHALWEAINRLGLPLPERVWRSTGEAAYAAGFWAPTEPTSGQGRRSNS
jgi:GT2 family glycosyltransferase